jgi:hypothetical protein
MCSSKKHWIGIRAIQCLRRTQYPVKEVSVIFTRQDFIQVSNNCSIVINYHSNLNGSYNRILFEQLRKMLGVVESRISFEFEIEELAIWEKWLVLE